MREVTNAGLENAAPDCNGRKCRIGIYGIDMQKLENTGRDAGVLSLCAKKCATRTVLLQRNRAMPLYKFRSMLSVHCRQLLFSDTGSS